jgi:hypothetical protein
MAEKIMRFMDLNMEEKRNMSANSSKIINAMSYENMGNELVCALDKAENIKSKKPSLVASLLINIWHGRYNTSGWDKL